MIQKGSNVRTENLIRNVKDNFSKIARDMEWNLSICEEHGYESYIVFSMGKKDISHRIGYLYSQSTDKSIYRLLEKTADVILIHGRGISFDRENQFSAGCTIPVIPDNEFLYVIIDWTMELMGCSPIINPTQKKSFSRENTIKIIEENPLEQIYTQLRALTSKSVAYKAVERHDKEKNTHLSPEIMDSKAVGVSHLIQNAIDYYSSASTENMTQRMLNLYYGTIAFMEAEMIVYGGKYKNLSKIEDVTKSGHGLTTFGDATDLKDFYVGAMSNGLFRAWLSHRGVDVSDFPASRKDVKSSEFKISLFALLCHIPELQNVLQEIDIEYKPYFLFPYYDMTFNSVQSYGNSVYQRKYNGSCIALLNLEGKCNYEWEKQLVYSFLAPFTIIGKYKGDTSEGWRVFVLHESDKKHWDSYNTHKGLSTTAIIAPLFKRTDAWDVYIVMILYTLSIIVRYMPNLWARIMTGDLDCYKAVFYQFSRIAERELTQLFLEKITNKHIIVTHPQALI